MSFGGWTGAEGTEVAGGGNYGQRPMNVLRPLSLGEILDRSFAVYRANFWLFVGIGSLSAAMQLLSNAVQLLVFHGIVPNLHQQAAQLRHEAIARQVASGIGGLLVLLVSAVTQAAIVWALSEVYLGRPTSIGEALGTVIKRWLRFVGIGLWQIWSAVWLLVPIIALGVGLVAGTTKLHAAWVGVTLVFVLVVGALVYGVIAFIRNSLGVQSAVLEQLKVRPAMRRSKVLTSGAKGRIFVVYLITWCLFLVVGMIEMPLSLLILTGVRHGQQHIGVQVVMLLVNFAAYSMVAPVMMIGLSLVYFDQRVRQDGLDLLLMLDGGTSAAANHSAAPPLEAGEPATDAAAL